MNALISVPHLLERVGDLAIPTAELIRLQHSMQIERFGGGAGMRDEGLLQSAVARGIMAASYEDDADAITIGCRICQGIIRNHPFVDGNKRAGFAALSTVLSLNGYRLDGEPEEIAEKVIGFAAGREDACLFESWVRDHTSVDSTYELIERKSRDERLEQDDSPSPGM